MSGFSTEWLELREPVDQQSRNAGLLLELAKQLANRNDLHFVDFGCGTGSNLRATALVFPLGQRQHWRLFDHDRNLLAQAGRILREWADHWSELEDGLFLLKKGREIHVHFHEVDLNHNLKDLISQGAIVTASAFFDLVSESWIKRFAQTATAARASVYTTLTYNGIEVWSPPHPDDRPILAAFTAHQRKDKGFGPAAGAKAVEALSEALASAGYKVEAADSPWRLDERHRSLIAALAKGSAHAVAELKLFDENVIAAWQKDRAAATACLIGHTDILAWPQVI